MPSITFPKIFTIGMKETARLFEGPVEVTEKVDGSQWNFGWLDGDFIMHSKGRRVYPENVDKMFSKGAAFALSVKDKLSVMDKNIILHGEYLNSPKHNILPYSRVPKNNYCLFGASNGMGTFYSPTTITEIAAHMDCDRVPIIYDGEAKANNLEQLKVWMDRESYLGGHKIEGVVIKNYAESVFIGGVVFPILSAKFVSEEFKEKHKVDFVTGKDNLALLMESYRTEARWRKAIQHIREDGNLTQSPADIGLLMREIAMDITTEDKEEIKEALWGLYHKDIQRKASAGFPEWYKEQLVLGTAA